MFKVYHDQEVSIAHSSKINLPQVCLPDSMHTRLPGMASAHGPRMVWRSSKSSANGIPMSLTDVRGALNAQLIPCKATSVRLGRSSLWFAFSMECLCARGTHGAQSCYF